MNNTGFLSFLKVDLPFFLVILLSLTIPLPLNVDKLTVILFSAAALLSFLINYHDFSFKNKSFLTSLPPIAYFLMLVIGVIHSQDRSLALSKVETSLPLFFLPLGLVIFLPYHKLSNNIERLLQAFAVGNLLAIIYILVALTINSSNYILIDNSFFQLFSRDNIAEQIGIHPIYISLFHALNVQALFYFLIVVKKNHNKSLKAFWLLCLVFSFFFIILLGAKMALVATVLSTILWLGYYIVSNKRYLYGFLLLVILATTVAIATNYIPNIKKRFEEVKDTELAPPRGLYHNSTNLRIGQLFCSLQVIQENPVWGVGTGDYQLELNKCYTSREYSDVLYLNNYNSHNQYIQAWIMNGIPGLLLLVSALIFPLYISIKNKDILILNVTLVFILCFLTESVLLTTKGIIVFSYFYMLFMMRSYHYEYGKVN